MGELSPCTADSGVGKFPLGSKLHPETGPALQRPCLKKKTQNVACYEQIPLASKLARSPHAFRTESLDDINDVLVVEQVKDGE